MIRGAEDVIWEYSEEILNEDSDFFLKNNYSDMT